MSGLASAASPARAGAPDVARSPWLPRLLASVLSALLVVLTAPGAWASSPSDAVATASTEPAASTEPDATSLETEGESGADAAESVRRFALLVGADDGGPERERLHYANRDATTLAGTLTRLGGVDPSDLERLEDPSPDALRHAFERMRKLAGAAQASGTKVHFIFYYSGHSDERSLLMGGPRFDYTELKRLVAAVPAEVHIAILDSCASGAFTRIKGGKRRPAFMAGDAAEVAGHAYLTSASADENAQESDTVGGSFFTHFLNSGLRGGADIDGDDRVTLDEAYRFAYDQTLRRTESTHAGAQHAAYDIELSGSGDLIMTDLRRATAKLVVARDVGGRIFVRDASGTLHAELEKVPGAPALVLALAPGEYRVTLDDGHGYAAASLKLDADESETLAWGDFAPVERQDASEKGDATTPATEVEATPDEGLIDRTVELSLVPPISLAGKDSARQRNKLAFGLVWTENAELDGVMMTVGGNMTHLGARGVQMSVGANIARGQMHGVQLSTGFNRAQQLRGFQGALVNSAHGALRPEHIPESKFDPADGAEYYSRGMQAGAVNLASGSFDGLQLGLINIADDAAAQLGLFSYDRRGGVHPHISTSELALVQVDLRFSARKTYTFLTWGIHPYGRNAGWNAAFGIGGRVRFGEKRRLFVDMDFATGALLYGLDRIEIPSALLRARIMFGYQPFRHLSVYGGLTGSISVDTHIELRDVIRPGYEYVTTDVETSRVTVRGWPGFVVGVGF